MRNESVKKLQAKQKAVIYHRVISHTSGSDTYASSICLAVVVIKFRNSESISIIISIFSACLYLFFVNVILTDHISYQQMCLKKVIFCMK